MLLKDGTLRTLTYIRKMIEAHPEVQTKPPLRLTHFTSQLFATGAPFWLCMYSAKKYSSRLPSKLIGELQLWQASLPLWQQSCVSSTNPGKSSR